MARIAADRRSPIADPADLALSDDRVIKGTPMYDWPLLDGPLFVRPLNDGPLNDGPPLDHQSQRVRIRSSVALLLLMFFPHAASPADQTVDFNNDIRPILSDHCFQCHGPDAENREADLRLDDQQSLFQVVTPGDVVASELVRRIVAQDDERMPPRDSGRELTEQQIQKIRSWVEQGARWQNHWSFVVPEWPQLPEVKNVDWCRSPIDTLVLKRLEEEGYQPSGIADRVTLVRRLAFDLTGLPARPDSVSEFLHDSSPDAYERLVDRLLNSPRFGERMATRWLDLARYADTSGYQNDGPRYMWRWRDWVIDAYNQDYPFDQFTIEQLAGDLLPNATLQQRIATGFNRNHRGNAEGGIVPEEFEVEYVVDRVDTTSTVWLGLSIGCARCHDHKYDPITQAEFYQLFAFFNNVPEYGRAIKEGNSPPYIPAPLPSQQRQLDDLSAEIDRLQRQADSRREILNRKQSAWEKNLDSSRPLDWSIRDGLVVHLDFGNKSFRQNQADGQAKMNITLEPQGEPQFAAWGNRRAVVLDDARFVNAGDVARFGYFDKFSISAWVNPAESEGTIVSRMTLAPEGDGYYLHLADGHLQVNFVKRWLDDSIRVETRRTIPSHQWTHLAMTYDGSRTAGAIRVYINGQPQTLAVGHDFLNQTFASDEPLRIGAGHGSFRGMIGDVRIYNRALSNDEVEVLSVIQRVDQIANLPPQQRTAAQHQKINDAFLALAAPPDARDLHRFLLDRRSALATLRETIPTLMVMQEMNERRETYVLDRGQYDRLGSPVKADVPAVLPPLRQGLPDDRLGLARWLVDPDHPLTPRVAVNRYWHMYFGRGLVRTMEDFGAQGERPTHPHLLDWLARQFSTRGWNIKSLQRLIVSSATYQQSSHVPALLAHDDPENQYLARGARFRLTAEMIRDQALASSGLLVERLGGPSVKPYQPEGLWKEIATDTDYELATGADLYRRSMYTYWKRTVSPPTMAILDAPTREACTAARPRTNTPLQALALMNDVTFVEASRVLSERLMERDDLTPRQRIELAFRRVTARAPADAEVEILWQSFQHQLRIFRKDAKAAANLINLGSSPLVRSHDVAELAAYTVICSLLFNLDETVTKQ